MASSGTGGTLGGVARYLKSRRADVRTVLADPQGSSLCHFVRHGELQAHGPGSITEGIGIARITANFAGAPIDEALTVSDAEAVVLRLPPAARGRPVPRREQWHQRRGAVRMARRLGPGHTIVTILCDTGAKYRQRLFDRQWLVSKGLERYAEGATDFPVYDP